MAYADQPAMSPRKLTGIAFVVIFHLVVGYAFINGLAYNVIKKAATELNVVDVQEEPPPPEAPPPPPPPDVKFEPPPIVAPPPIVQVQTTAPVITTVPTPPVIHEAAPPAPPPPPPPPSVAKPAQLRGVQNFGITDEDYPPAAQRNEEQGVTAVAFDIGLDGRVTNCRVTGSSGSSTLDTATCTLITRRARYNPAQDAAGNKIVQSGYKRSIRWVLPKD